MKKAQETVNLYGIDVTRQDLNNFASAALNNYIVDHGTREYMITLDNTTGELDLLARPTGSNEEPEDKIILGIICGGHKTPRI